LIRALSGLQFLKKGGRPAPCSFGVKEMKKNKKIKKSGQVTVELMLVLPVFFMMLFFIMEIGNLGFQTILAHHCAYELARIGSLVAGPTGYGNEAGARSDSGRAIRKMQSVAKQMFPSSNVRVEGRIVNTTRDDQAGVWNEDLIVTLHYPAKLIFPGSSHVFADNPKNQRIKKLKVSVRMPIEKPFYN